jgi:hypothetical protein
MENSFTSYETELMRRVKLVMETMDYAGVDRSNKFREVVFGLNAAVNRLERDCTYASQTISRQKSENRLQADKISVHQAEIAALEADIVALKALIVLKNTALDDAISFETRSMPLWNVYAYDRGCPFGGGNDYKGTFKTSDEAYAFSQTLYGGKFDVVQVRRVLPD